MVTKNNRILALLLAGIIVLSLIVPTFADETVTDGGISSESTVTEEETEYVPVETILGEITLGIKEGSTGNLDTLLSRYIRDEFDVPSGFAVITSGDKVVSTTGKSGVTVYTLRMENKDTYVATVNWTVETPETFKLEGTLDNIKATHTSNKSASALLSYVNSDLELTPYGDAYEEALGNGKAYKAPGFKWDHADTDYDPYGGRTYIFSNDFQGSTIVRTVKVNEVVYPRPNVYIDYDNDTLIGLDTDMSYSLDGTKWTKCKEDMKITSSWYDKTLYFQYQETANNYASATDSLYIPPKSEAPTEALKLEATSHSVTITNCWDFEGVEYSINGEDWYTTNDSTYTFTRLAPNTSYKVYVRTAADYGDWLASTSKTASIKTTEAPTNGVDITYTEGKKSADLKAVGSVASSVSSTSLSGSYNTSTLSKFKSIVNNLANKYDDVTVNMLINHYAEDGETYNITNYTFSIPVSSLSDAAKKTDFTLTYRNDLMDVVFDSNDLYYYAKKTTGNSLSINIQEPTSISNTTSLKWLRNQFNNDRPVYKVSVKAGSYDDTNVTYVIPYKLKTNETIPGVSVYGVDSKGTKYDLMAEYDFIEQCFRVNTDFQGYIVIVKDNEAEVMPFQDVPVNYWAYNTVKYCYNRGIFAGTSATTFHPQNHITRAHIFTLLARIGGVELDEIKIDKNAFTDINENHWAYRQAHWALQNKLISGKEFRPDETMTRAEITTYLYKFMIDAGVKDNVTKEDKVTNYYTDMDKQKGDAQKAAIFMNKNGIMVGTGNMKFDPDSNVTRAHMATILYRINTILENME